MAGGPGERFALGPGPLTAEPIPQPEAALPSHHGTGRLELVARDPHWLYAHWDLADTVVRPHLDRAGEGCLHLRIFIGAPEGPPFCIIRLAADTLSWFAYVGRAATDYVGELGYFDRDGHWVSLVVSAPVTTPPDRPASEPAATVANIPLEVPFKQILAEVEALVPEVPPLVEALERLREAGFEELPAAVQPVTTPWSPAQERALAEVVRVDPERRVWVGSLDITQLVRDRLAAPSQTIPDVPGPAASPMAGFGGPPAEAISSAGAVPAVPSRARGFWLNVNAELVIYGATEPDATLTIGGRTVRLRSDGSFSLRFALPDGEYELPVVARSPAGDDGRRAALRFARQTAYEGEVGAHPQDPALRSPRAENLPT